MFLFTRRARGLRTVAALCCLFAVSACQTTAPAYFQSQSNSASRLADPELLTTPADSLPESTPSNALTSSDDKPAVVLPTASVTAGASGKRPVRHLNPESRSRRQIRRLIDLMPMAHVPVHTEQIDRHSPVRKTHPMGLAALGLAVLSYGSLLAGGSTLVLVLSLVFPLAAVLMGVASLTAIHRNRDRYRGKGWAMAAIVVGTGAMGLALVAVAALSVSRVVWEK